MYRNDISALSAFIESSLQSTSYTAAVIMGDTNFDIVPGHAGFDIFNSLLCSADMLACDELVSGALISPTYVNAALNASSKLDHFFVSRQLLPCIKSVSVIDCSATNYSDHRPISMGIDIAQLSPCVPTSAP